MRSLELFKPETHLVLLDANLSQFPQPQEARRANHHHTGQNGPIRSAVTLQKSNRRLDFRVPVVTCGAAAVVVVRGDRGRDGGRNGETDRVAQLRDGVEDTTGQRLRFGGEGAADDETGYRP